MNNYLAVLEHSFAQEKIWGEREPITRLAYLAVHIFDFTTYDSEMDELFAAKAVEVCAAISERKTFDYIADAENYKWYLLMCNMPFFADRIEWGTSIRGAWWQHTETELDSCGLWDGEEQMTALLLSAEDWRLFVAAVVEFGRSLTTDTGPQSNNEGGTAV